ncbi:MAG: PQQ-binding-like beta-propeller repeat protein [Planctomycetes bacterium]|nr:PQQ-binding-like beta-propeller repeat protein [Planctomycetota bacterium]
MWRYDASRGAASPISLPAELHLQWVRDLPRPAPAWSEEQYKLQFDRSYEPVVMGRQIFVPSMVRDKITAYDTETGEQNWQFFCDGPVRFAPIAWQGRVYFVSDDGCLYCLDAREGGLRWKLRLAPSERKAFGNGRLISAWPARGGPVLLDGKIYCAASIWPFMGVFLYAVDAATGKVIWENSGSGATYFPQPHNSPAFSGVAPQGYLAAGADKLLVTGRTIPACFDLKTGELLYYRLSETTYGKTVGGCGASIWNDWYFNGKVAYRLSDGLPLGAISGQVMTKDTAVGIDATGNVMAYKLAETETQDTKTKKPKTVVLAKARWKAKPEPALERIHLAAGNRLYGSTGQGEIAALRIPESNQPAETVWRQKVSGRVWNMLAGDGKLFVVTEEGQLYCFGAAKTNTRHYQNEATELSPGARGARRRIQEVLQQAPDAPGYCLWLGTRNRGLLRELLRQSSLHVIVIEPDATKVASLRQEFDRAGLYGSRICVLPGDVNSLGLPPYSASLVVVQNSVAAGLDGSKTSVERLYSLLRPYSGMAWVAGTRQREMKAIQQADLAGLKVESLNNTLLLKRTGPVPGSANWTHQYGDVANTVCSKDQLKPPLGLLWFGEESAFGDVLPRHGHGPPEQVVDGRLFIEGIDSLSARDVYTGKTLWRKPLKEPGSFGVYYNSSYKHDFRDLGGNQKHIPGANVRGTNFVATSDHVYVIQEAQCHVLDVKSGQTEQVFSLPGQKDQPQKEWGYIGVCDDCLIAGSGFVKYPITLGTEIKDANIVAGLDWVASRQLVGMNRRDGQVLWAMDAQRGFLHNGIAAGQGKVFCLDAAPYATRIKNKATTMKNARPETLDPDPRQRLVAVDLHSGQILWENRDRVFGSWLSYSQEHDILLQAYRKSRDMPLEPGNRMAAFRGATGEVLWDKKITYEGPCMLHGATIITQESAYDLLTGEQKMRAHPLTGEPVPWKYSRNYGCNFVVASANLLTFRSAAAGFYDLTTDAGTGNFGGFKSGCTSNLVVANGVLNAPDYTETCTCSYQNQTSLAMIHMPEIETWAFSSLEAGTAPIQRAGVNLGAPGDRVADNGTLWLEYPSVGGASPKLDIVTTPEKPSFFRRHSLRLAGGDLTWVEASGARGLRSIRIGLAGHKPGVKIEVSRVRLNIPNPEISDTPVPPRNYTVSLHFMEPEDKKPGERVFDVALGDRTVLKDFDIVAEAKSPNVGLVKKFSGVVASDSLTVSLTPADPSMETILCGIEIAAEDSASSK